MRVVNFSAVSIGTDSRVRKTSAWLKRQGHEVYNVTGFGDDFGTGAIAWGLAPLDGVPTFCLARNKARQALEFVLDLKPDVIHVHDLDPFWILFGHWEGYRGEDGLLANEIGLTLEKLEGVKVVFDAHEYEPSRFLPEQLDTPRHHLDRRYRWDRALEMADHVVTVSPMIVDRIKSESNVTPLFVPNCCVHPDRPFQSFSRVFAKCTDQDFLVGFVGNITPPRQIPMLIDAVLELDERYKLILIGALRLGPDEQDHMAKLMDSGRGYYVPKQPYFLWNTPAPAHLDWVAGCDVGYNGTPIGFRENYEMSLANKVFEYAAAGVPQVVPQQMIDSARLVSDYGIGGVFDQLDKDSLKDEIEWLCESNHRDVMLENLQRFNTEWNFDAIASETLGEIYGY